MTIPKHMPPVLAIGNRMEAEVNLGLHYLLDILIFDGAEMLLSSLFLVNSSSGLEQPSGSQQGAKVFCSERRSLMQFGCHCGYCWCCGCCGCCLTGPQLTLQVRLR